MATNTPNYNLKKPASTDMYDVGDSNGNMDILDSALMEKQSIWIPTKTYALMDAVMSGKGWFLSKQNGNIGHDPWDDSDALYQGTDPWWSLITMATTNVASVGDLLISARAGSDIATWTAPATALASILNPKLGPYNSSRAYVSGEYVYDSNGIWYCYNNAPAGSGPPNTGAGSNSYWGSPQLYAPIDDGSDEQVLTKTGPNWFDYAWRNIPASLVSATKTGTNAFPGGGTTDVVNDAAILAGSFPVISPTGTKAGTWTATATAGTLTVTSTATEAATATYNWAVINDGVPADLLVNGAAATLASVAVPKYEDYDIDPALQVNTLYRPDGNSVVENPISAMLWHDVAAFCKTGTPVQESSVDGSTGWTADTLNKNMFSHKTATAVQVLDASTKKGVRWTWSAGISWANIEWVMIAFGNAGWLNRTITIQTSVDGSAWTNRCVTSTDYDTLPLWFPVSDIDGAAWLRVTITTAATSGTMTIASFQLLTCRWGEQGMGDELSFPYTWDADQNITVGGTLALPNAALLDNSVDTILAIKGCSDGAAGNIEFRASNGAAGYLSVDNTFFGASKSGESYTRTVINFADGKIGMGPGNATRDTWLYRDAANSLKTDGTFSATGGVKPAPKATTIIEEDFLTASSNTLDHLTGAAISSGTMGAIAGTKEHPGIAYLRDSTTANGGYTVRTDTTPFLISGGEKSIFIFQAKGAKSTAGIRMGFEDSFAIQTQPTDAVCFENASRSANVLRGMCKNNAGPTYTGTTYTMSADTWYRGEITVNAAATSVNFSLYLCTTGALLWSSDVTGNIPTATGRELGWGVVAAETSTDAAADILWLDYMALSIERALVR
jgi:hypothetical protein